MSHHSSSAPPYKRLLMVAYYFGDFSIPGALRTMKFAQYLPDYGWHTEIITASQARKRIVSADDYGTVHCSARLDPSIPMGKAVKVFYSFLKKFKKTKNSLKNSQKKRSTPPPEGGLGLADYLLNFFCFPDQQIFWLLWSLPKIFLKARYCNCIYTTGPPHSTHLAGLMIKTFLKKPWIIDYRDEWTLERRFNPPSALHKWLAGKLDRIFIEHADFVINVTEINSQRFFEFFGGVSSKYVTITNGFDELDVREFRKIAPSPNGPCVLTYVGSLYGGRDAKRLITAISELIVSNKVDKDQIKVQLIGSKSQKLRKLIEELDLNDCIILCPRISQKAAFQRLAKSHIGLIIGSDMERTAFTTKVFEYAGMGKSIFAIVPEGPVADFVRKCDGWVADYQNIRSIKENIIQILKAHKNGLFKSNQLPDFVKQKDRKKLTGKLAECLNKLTI